MTQTVDVDVIDCRACGQLAVSGDETCPAIGIYPGTHNDAAARLARAIEYHGYYLDRAREHGQDIDRDDYDALDNEMTLDKATETEQQVEDDVAAMVGAYGYDHVRKLLDGGNARPKLTVYVVVWDLDNSGTSATAYRTLDEAQAAVLSFWQTEARDKMDGEGWDRDVLQAVIAAKTLDDACEAAGGDFEAISNEDWITIEECEL